MNKLFLNSLKERLAKIFKSRIFYVGLGITVAMTAISARLYYLQIVQGEQHKDNAATINKVVLYTETPRGNIYDRNGILLATNRVAYKVQMVNVDRDQSFRDEMYLKVINLLDEMGEDYNNPLKRYIDYPIAWGSYLEGEENEDRRKAWINGIALRKSDRDKINTAKDAFDYLRNVVFKFDESYTDEEAYKIMILRYQTYTMGLSYMVPLTIADDVSSKTMEIIEARHLEFPGIYTEEVYYREYVHDETLSHIIGYVRAINSEEYEALKDQGYDRNSLIGKNGIERAAESLLRGVKGTRTVYQDIDTGIVRELSSTEPIPGHDIYLTIDVNLQRAAYDALVKTIEDIIARKDNKKNFGDAKAGSVVVTDVRTGEVLAMANYPTYDNKIFLAPSSDEEAQRAITELFQDPDSPSLNRATQGLYPVGSTFKTLVAIAALEEGVMTPYQKIKCLGMIEVNNRVHRCNAYHYDIDMVRAIAESCNVYFYETGIKTGIKNLDKWAKAFGLGEKTGIEIPEYAGYRNNEETMKLMESDIYHVWTPSDTAQASIGQLYNLFTPIQLSNYAAAIANGGYLNKPRLIAASVSNSGHVEKYEAERKNIGVKEETLKVVQEGMITMSKLSGIAKREYRGFPDGFAAGKTGTPQTGLEAFGRSSHSVYICYAPSDNPEIAISVVIEYGASGSNSIAVAGEVLRAYYGDTGLGEGLPARKDGLGFGDGFRNFKSLIQG